MIHIFPSHSHMEGSIPSLSKKGTYRGPSDSRACTVWRVEQNDSSKLLTTPLAVW